MGYNPHKKGPTSAKKKQFGLDLFVDVYNAYEKEFGKEFMGNHVAMGAMYIDGNGQGEIEICGTVKTSQYMFSLLLLRLASTQRAIIMEHTKGKEDPSVLRCARMILDQTWDQLSKMQSLSERPSGLAPKQK